MTWLNQYTMPVHISAPEAEPLELDSAESIQIRFQGLATCGRSWRINQVHLQDQDGSLKPIQNWFFTAVTALEGTDVVVGVVKFDVAAFNVSEPGNPDRDLLTPRLLAGGVDLMVQISFLETSRVDDFSLRLQREP